MALIDAILRFLATLFGPNPPTLSPPAAPPVPGGQPAPDPTLTAARGQLVSVLGQRPELPDLRAEPIARLLDTNAPVTAQTPFRQIGDVSVAAWQQETAGTPLAGVALECMAAASPHGALALSQAKKESQLGKTAPAGTNNPLGLLDYTGATPTKSLVYNGVSLPFRVFATWADAFAAFRDRLSDLGYKGGVYGGPDTTLEQYIVTYVAGPGCWSSRGATCANGETWRPGGGRDAGSVNLYLAQTSERVNRYRGIGATPVPTPAPVPPAGEASIGQRLADYARTFVGRPYATHRDCSGFTAHVAQHVAGLTIPQGSRAQMDTGTTVAQQADILPGDLMFWDTASHHVGIAVTPGGTRAVSAFNERQGIIEHATDAASVGGAYQGARRLVAAAAPTLDPMRPMPYPAMVRLIVEKAYDGAGFDRVAFRGTRIVGVADHITQGSPGGDDIGWYARFFGIGGERARDALTDTVIGRDGRIGLLNDWRDPQWGGTRAGWANGGSGGPSGIGVAFRRRFPLINDVLVSKEHVKGIGQPLTDAQIDSSAQLTAAVAHNAGVSAATFPEDARYGVNVSQYHDVLSAKPECPGSLFLTRERPLILNEAQRLMAAWQGSGTNGPAPVPVPTITYTMYGMTLETVADLFGTMARHNADGTVDELPFSPTGPLSLLWLKRAEQRGQFPEAESMKLLDTGLGPGREWVATWEGGWVAVLPAGDTKATWRWLDETKEAA